MPAKQAKLHVCPLPLEPWTTCSGEASSGRTAPDASSGDSDAPASSDCHRVLTRFLLRSGFLNTASPATLVSGGANGSIRIGSRCRGSTGAAVQPSGLVSCNTVPYQYCRNLETLILSAFAVPELPKVFTAWSRWLSEKSSLCWMLLLDIGSSSMMLWRALTTAAAKLLETAQGRNDQLASNELPRLSKPVCL